MQKPFQFCIPALKTPQLEMPYWCWISIYWCNLYTFQHKFQMEARSYIQVPSCYFASHSQLIPWLEAPSSINKYYTTHSYFIYVLKIGYGWNLWLKVLSIICTYITRNIFEIHPCARPFSDLPCWLSQFSKTKLRQPTGQTWKRPFAWRNF